jgi:hypothetical protein
MADTIHLPGTTFTLTVARVSLDIVAGWLSEERTAAGNCEVLTDEALRPFVRAVRGLPEHLALSAVDYTGLSLPGVRVLLIAFVHRGPWVPSHDAGFRYYIFYPV